MYEDNFFSKDRLLLLCWSWLWLIVLFQVLWGGRSLVRPLCSACPSSRSL